VGLFRLSADGQAGWLPACLSACLAGRLAAWLLPCWLAGLLAPNVRFLGVQVEKPGKPETLAWHGVSGTLFASSQARWLAGWLAACLPGCLSAWLAGCLPAWLAG